MDLTADLSGRDPFIKTEKSLHARFFLYPVYQKFKSEQEGRNIYIDKEYIEIFIPGDKTTVNRREATQEDKVRFEKQYKAFKDGQHQATEGTPLEEWPLLKPSQILPMKAMHIYTVEQLAELNDVSLQRIGPGTRDLKQKATEWLGKNKKSEELEAALRLRDAQISQLKQQLTELQARMDAPQTPPKVVKKKGWPKGKPRKLKETSNAS